MRGSVSQEMRGHKRRLGTSARRIAPGFLRRPTEQKKPATDKLPKPRELRDAEWVEWNKAVWGEEDDAQG